MKNKYLVISIILIVIIIGFLISELTYAGSVFVAKCSNCGFSGEFKYGSGFYLNVIANGYCCECNKIVSITCTQKTTEEEIKALKKPIGFVFDFRSKQKKELFPCPHCKKPFIRINENDFKTFKRFNKAYCPKCGKKKFRIVHGFVWD